MSGARGRARLAERVAEVPARLRERPAAALHPPFDPAAARCIRVTGAGASGAHARLLAARLAEAGRPAVASPPSRFARPPGPEAAEEVLVVFSQGLSPNARAALAQPGAWRATVLVTAAGDAREEARALRDALTHAGTWIVDTGARAEFGTLVRVQGPALALCTALELAAALGAPPAPPAAAAADAFAGAAARAARAAAALPDAAFAGAWQCLGGAGDLEAVDAQRLKLAEGLRRPLPPACDLLDFAHGPFQQLFAAEALLTAFAGGAGREDEEELLARLRGMLEPRHRLLPLPPTQRGDLALFEHEAAADALLLRALEACDVDPARWEGAERDAPLYGISRPLGTASAPAAAPVPAPAAAAAPTPAPVAAPERRLETLTWPELEALCAAGVETAVIPLGSTEQHGPHLPFATDTWIADALAERFVERVPEALRLPALPLGCASEHLGFPGTLHLEGDTLEAVLGDLVRSLDGHGFAHVFVFSAHGGNLERLRGAAPSLAAAATRARVTCFTDHARLTARLHAEATRLGVTPEAAGHHAGEIETSILAARRPGAVRRERLAAGPTDPVRDVRMLFYPDLRRHAPDGTVGDPRGAHPARAEAYLEAWTALLVEAYRAAKKRQDANGTVRP